ncbi:helix-turn-helix domain-containing protein [Zemynaea arenosa]|uniref:helix-turn-helix domain-containing protein n=1 Tax=Zemynaea arenosa TaxID=2561931 RepID=UPI0027D969F2|nr:helix-turn-helix domain-containing protein [Massilia arenosa]
MTDRAKGVVDPAAAARAFRLERYLPAPPFHTLLDHYWLVEWDLRGQPPFVQRTLPYPCVHLVFDREQTGIWGVPTRYFEKTLTGQNRVLGLRFRPGAFRALLGRPLKTIQDVVLPLEDVFGADAAAHAAKVLAAPDDARMVAVANELLARVLPAQPDPQVERIAAILALAQDDPQLTRAEQLAERAGLALRTLQELFGEYVGVSPKWVLCRYRLHEAADRLAANAEVDLAALAQALGYYDQAHFTTDFQSLVGKTPAEYRKANAAAPQSGAVG